MGSSGLSYICILARFVITLAGRMRKKPLHTSMDSYENRTD